MGVLSACLFVCFSAVGRKEEERKGKERKGMGGPGMSEGGRCIIGVGWDRRRQSIRKV